MIALSVANLKLFSLNKAKKEKNKLFRGKFGSMPTFRSARKSKKCFSFVMSLPLSDLKVLHNIASSLRFFFSISLGFPRCFHSYFILQIVGV